MMNTYTSKPDNPGKTFDNGKFTESFLQNSIDIR